ncbi:hypothetical protein RUM44_010360 [Polyplax serrata]|uniref:Uncharacterized protein n=1 Tax=Polyplax serrata TaxID=468196 RepID=A0ABR1AVA9_POLSC
MKVKQYPGRAVLVSKSIGEDNRKMEVMYESSWNDFDWKSDSARLYTNYMDWLQESSDTGSDSEGSSNNRSTVGYYQSYPSHYYNVKNQDVADCHTFRSDAESMSDRSLVINPSTESRLEENDEERQKGQNKNGRSSNEKVSGKTKESISSTNNQNCYWNGDVERSRLIQANNKNESDQGMVAAVESIHQRNRNSKLEKLIARNGGHDLERKEPSVQLSNGNRKSFQGRAVDESEDVDNCQGPAKSTITYSKSMRCLKEASENGGTRPQLKHSKSMRSLKNRDSQRKSPTSDKFSASSIRKLLKIPEILKTSPGSVRKKDGNETDLQSISNLRAKSLLKGFENPGMHTEENTDQRLSKLLVNSKPFSTASQSRLDTYEENDECLDRSNKGVHSLGEGFRSDPGFWERDRRIAVDEDGLDEVDKALDPEINNRLMDFYSKNGKEGKSILKTLTLRLKKKITNKEKSMSGGKDSNSDEYIRAGLYTRQKKTETPGYVTMQPQSNESLCKDPDFLIPRPKLIVPVHTYGIRKRRTGNMMHSIRTRSDDTTLCSGDTKKTHHTSCPGRFPEVEVTW